MAGDIVAAEADIFADGHDVISAVLQYRHQSEKKSRELRMRLDAGGIQATVVIPMADVARIVKGNAAAGGADNAPKNSAAGMTTGDRKAEPMPLRGDSSLPWRKPAN